MLHTHILHQSINWQRNYTKMIIGSYLVPIEVFRLHIGFLVSTKVNNKHKYYLKINSADSVPMRIVKL